MLRSLFEDLERARTGDVRLAQASSEEIAWLAGLLDGEGHLSLKASGHRRKSGGRYAYPIVQLVMKDRRVVERAANLMGSGVHGVRNSGRPYWRTTLLGHPAVDVMKRIRPWLIEKASSVDNAIASYNVPRRDATVTHCDKGHELTPENTYWSPGRKYRQCRTCRRAYGAAATRKSRMRKKETSSANLGGFDPLKEAV